jgi:tRNA nucleotidyltransferase (CCA-adding enzyme)
MFKELNHKVYVVGGAIRNKLMGLAPKDIDYVVEATEAEYEAVFPNHKKLEIMGKFPVYLNENGDEVALTRKEEFTNGGGDSNVIIKDVGTSIHHDLSRRDFSINSIAEHFVTGEIVDPFGGVEDIENGLLRTVNDQFVIQDPNRVYRLARFVAEFGFRVEEKTADIVRRDRNAIYPVYVNGELEQGVTPERVYAELKKTYERTEKPSLFFSTLLDLNVLHIHFKPLYVMSKISAGPNKFHGGKTAFEHALDAFDYAKANDYSFDVALAGLFHDTGKGVSRKAAEGEIQHHYNHEVMSYLINKVFVKQHRFTAHQNELIVLFARQHMYFHLLEKIKNPIKLVRFFKKIKNHVDELVLAANTDHLLNEEQVKIIENLKLTFKTTSVTIPKDVEKRGRDAIVDHVNNLYAQRYKELSR